MFNARTVSKLVLEGRLSFKNAVHLFERFLLSEVLKKFKGNQSRAAKFLNLHRNSVRNKLKQIHAA